MIINGIKNNKILVFFVFVLLVLFFRTLEVPLLGSHSWRQADTNSMSYSFCKEDANILYPRVPIREETSGVAIGEFPIFSWINALPCMLTGQWYESFPRLMTLVYFLLGAYFWSQLFVKRELLDSKHAATFFLIYLFSTLNFIFLTRTLPDGLALLLVALSGHLYLNKSPYLRGGGALLFALAFLIRPYLAGLLFLVSSNWKDRIASGFLLLASYFFWFRYWKTNNTVNNFNIRLKPIEELLSDAPEALVEFLPHILKWQMNVVGLVVLFVGWKYYRKYFWIWTLTVLILLLTSGKHYINHQYYMLGSMLLLVWFISLSLAKSDSFSKNQKLLKGFLFLYCVIAISSRGYEFNFPKTNDWKDIPNYERLKTLEAGALITTADGLDPNWLYYSKRFGYTMFPPSEKSSDTLCRGSSAIALYREEGQIKHIECK